jgi:2-polyprenyl-6-methoxyphenol hydroxylase-like FAD-dependent oxidoreductase
MLGHLVANSILRRALFRALQAHDAIRLYAGLSATGITTNSAAALVTLEDGTMLNGRLVVASDTRFSDMRRRMGIAARMHDFGMLAGMSVRRDC